MANFNSAIPYIKKAEGGLSRDQKDPAAKFASPYTYKGLTGWHTNKGITYQTFKGLSAKLGYADNATNFLTMPDAIWLAIYKNGYWMPTKCELVNSQAIANALVDYAWAFGAEGARTRIVKWMKAKYNVSVSTYSDIAAMFNKLTVAGDRQVFYDFIEARKQAFIATGQTTYIKAWLGRMDALIEANKGLLQGGATALIAICFVVGSFFF